jgi:hypothetical protein
MLKKCFLLAMTAATLTLGSCADEKEEKNSVDVGGENATGNASAEEVAEEQRGDVNCPAKAQNLRGQGAPVDDVVGARPGMTWDEARNFVLCDNPLLVVTENKARTFSIQLHGAIIRQGFDAKFAEARVEKSSKEIMVDMQRDFTRRQNNVREDPLRPGQVRYYVGTMGTPGQERVISVAREEYYSEGRQPPITNIEQALIAKYGRPTTTSDNPRFKNLSWKSDPTGRPITETSPLFNRCNSGASPDHGSNLSPDCGVTVSAQIEHLEGNPGLARGLAVSSQNGAEGYAMLERTESALAAAENARQANELKNAEQSADEPKL